MLIYLSCNNMTWMRLLGSCLLAAAVCLSGAAQAMEIPPGWDLTFAAQRAEAPPIRSGINDTFNLYEMIDRRGWQIRYFLQQVPVSRLDEAVFLEYDLHQRFGLFIEGEHAWLLRDRDYSAVTMREVEIGAAHKIIGQYARHHGPKRWASFQITDSIACSATVAHAVVSVYQAGKSQQYWLSGADFCEISTELLTPVKMLLSAGHAHTTHTELLWAGKLEKELLALPAVGEPLVATALERSAALKETHTLLESNASTEALCQAANQLLDLPSRDGPGRARKYDTPDPDLTAAMVALMGRIDTRCTYKTGDPLLEILVMRSEAVVIEAALKAGFPVNEKHYHTPLDTAIFEKRPDVQEILERAGGVRYTTLGK
jgi:hypothetical protein